MKTLSFSENQSLESVSRLLNINPVKLSALIDFESQWNPKAVNKITGAIGLIQFMPKTLKSMGFASPAQFIAQNNTIEKQLKYVYLYLKEYMPLDTDKKLFMSVFYPIAATWPDIKQFPAIVQKSNPGITRVSDYMKKVYLRIGIHYIPKFFFVVVGLSAVYYIIRHRKQKK
jgi:hypothetical protein